MEGFTVKEWRLIKEISAAEMARRLKVNIQTYQKNENEPERIPLGKAKLFCEIVGQPFEVVFSCVGAKQNVAQ